MLPALQYNLLQLNIFKLSIVPLLQLKLPVTAELLCKANKSCPHTGTCMRIFLVSEFGQDHSV